MNTRANLTEVFNEFTKSNITVNVANSCCHTINSDSVLEPRGAQIVACVSNMDDIMDDIDGEGSAEVSWSFSGGIGSQVANIFQQKGYIVEWSEDMGNKITAVIEEEDLPPDFIKKWRSNDTSLTYSKTGSETEKYISKSSNISDISDVSDISDISDIEDNVEVFKDNENVPKMCKKCASASTVCDNDCGTIMCEFCGMQWYFGNTGDKAYGHHPDCGGSDSDDEERVDPDVDIFF